MPDINWSKIASIASIVIPMLIGAASIGGLYQKVSTLEEKDNSDYREAVETRFVTIESTHSELSGKVGRQWSKITKNQTSIVELESRTRNMERIITPESMQEWGRVKAQVEENKKDIEKLQNNR